MHSCVHVGLPEACNWTTISVNDYVRNRSKDALTRNNEGHKYVDSIALLAKQSYCWYCSDCRNLKLSITKKYYLSLIIFLLNGDQSVVIYGREKPGLSDPDMVN